VGISVDIITKIESFKFIQTTLWFPKRVISQSRQISLATREQKSEFLNYSEEYIEIPSQKSTKLFSFLQISVPISSDPNT
jgi:hypothetical protein